MAESHKFKTLADAEAVFADLPWQQDGGGNTAIFDAKQEQYVPVTKGQYIVSIADRYEVHDEEPAKAKPAEAPKAAKSDEPKAPKAEAEEKPADEKSTGIESAIPVAS